MPRIKNKDKFLSCEAYRTLRTNLKYSCKDNNYKVIAITSSEAGEGKTVTAVNLAIALAQEDKKVLLIDCDLRNPSIHKILNISNDIGLLNILEENKTLISTSNRYSKNLVILPSGGSSLKATEFLGSDLMTKLINEYKSTFDYIILDTPPIQPVTDAQIISAKADGTIFVVRAEKTGKNSVKNSINLLKMVNTNIIGTILNGVDIKRNEYLGY